MVDVTKENFEQLWPSIKENIDQSVLIGIDSEFSGIRFSSKLKNRYVTVILPKFFHFQLISTYILVHLSYAVF